MATGWRVTQTTSVVVMVGTCFQNIPPCQNAWAWDYCRHVFPSALVLPAALELGDDPEPMGTVPVSQGLTSPSPLGLTAC